MSWSMSSGVTLRYHVSGRGNRSLILVHELGGSLESWDALVPLLEDSYRILRYDQRGSGLSEKVRFGYTVDDLVRDLQALVEATGLAPPHYVMGVAAGATVALGFAQQTAERVAGVILCCPSIGVSEDRKRYLMERSELAAREGMRAVADTTFARSFPVSEIRDRAAYETYRTRFLVNDPVSYGLANRALIEADLETAISTVCAPCLVIAGSRDMLRPPEMVKDMASRLKNATFSLVDGGHLLHLHSPQLLAERIMEFASLEHSSRAESRNGSQFVNANGLRFHCRVDGPEGAPWIVLSNSLMTNLSLWDDQVAMFSGSYRLLRYDQRGHGDTEVPATPCSFQLLAMDAIALMDAFSIGHAIVMGVSMGAVTALLLAARYPERIKAVVASDGQWSAPSGAAALWEQRIEVATEQGMSALAEPTVRRWFAEESVNGGMVASDKVRHMIGTTPEAGFIACARALQGYDFQEEFAAIRLAVLLIVGAKDGALHETMKAMHAAIAGSRLEEISGAGHLPNIERPWEFNRAIAAFLHEIAPPTSPSDYETDQATHAR